MFDEIISCLNNTLSKNNRADGRSAFAIKMFALPSRVQRDFKNNSAVL